MLVKNTTLIKNVILLVLVLIAIMFFVDKCSAPAPVPGVTTTINIEQIKDSIKNALVKDVKPIYIDTTKAKIKWLRPKEKIVVVTDTFYKENEDDNAGKVLAQKYFVELKSNQAKADLEITTTGELYDVTGVIEFPKETITITERFVDRSPHLSVYTMSTINRVSPEIGLIYKTKGSLSLMGAIQYNDFTQQGEIKLGAALTILNKK